MSNRQMIESEYEIKDGVIKSPGKFEGEPIYAPYFYDAYLNGMADDDDGERLKFDVTAEDREEFPELQNIDLVILWEDGSGFVFVEVE